jgi:uncharacterized protein (DUF433 family)
MTTTYPHIEFAPDGTARISGTNTKVEEVVLDHLAHSWGATEIHRQHPHLSLAEIYSALAYYYDHRQEMDAIIEEGLRQVLAIQESLPPSSIRLKLKALGLLT